jgi:hypothetical protein
MQHPADAYSCRQADLDAAYRKAWADAPEEFKQSAMAKGLKPDTARESHACEYNEASEATSYHDNFDIDTEMDRLIEELGPQHAKAIEAVMTQMEARMRAEMQRESGSTVTRIVCYLIKTEKGNLQARVHQLLHAIPGLAEAVGFSSMRSSARACGVSPEWMRRGREEWCDVLGLDIPAASSKSPEARLAYSKNGLKNHWRNQKFKASSD